MLLYIRGSQQHVPPPELARDVAKQVAVRWDMIGQPWKNCHIVQDVTSLTGVWNYWTRVHIKRFGQVRMLNLP